MKSWVEVLIIIALAIGVNFLCQGIFSLIKSSRLHPYLSRHSLGRKALLLIPGIFIYFALFYVYDRGNRTLVLLHKLDLIYLIVVFIIIADAILMTFLDLYSQSDKNKSHPLKGLVQGLQVVLFFIGGILIIAILIDKSPTVLLTSLGASAAVLMLVFKDSILGFVAGVQLSQNNMIRIGDWIQLPDGSANGVVEEITLNTVKVRNWDNTITTIPPYTLVSSPFKNWRGMQESGGRRSDKCIYIDLNSLEVCSEEMIADLLKTYPVLGSYVKRAVMASGRSAMQLTNIQLFRAYIEAYLKEHPDVNPSLDIIVTQKEATAYGLPIEVYFFVSDKTWASYERKQSDIFDHLMTIVSDFGLRMYQRP